MRRQTSLGMMVEKPESAIPGNKAVAAILCAALLAGCGASLNSESLNGDLQTEAINQQLTDEKKADASLTPDPKSKSSSEPVSLATTVAPKPKNNSDRKSASFAAAAEPFIASATPGATGYKIGPQDVLEISVFKVPELSRTAQVADIGTINLPLVGEVPAAGKTARDIERDLTAKLGAKYLQSPQVSVAVKEYNSQRVTIEGAVKKPGVYPVQSKTTLLQLTAMAQGLTPDADNSAVVIMRQANGKRSAQRFNIDEIRSGRSEDPALQKGDVVVVSHSAMKAAWQNFLTGLGVAGKAVVFF